MQAILSRTLVAAAFAAAASAQAPKAPPTSGADLVPTSAYGVVQFGGLERCAANTRKWPIAEMVSTFLGKLPDETRDEHLERGLSQAAGQVRRVFERAQIAPADVRDLLSCPMTFVMGRLTIEGMGPSIAVMIELGNREAAVMRLLARGEELVRRGGAAPAAAAEVNGVAVKQLQIQQGPPVFVANLAGQLCITNSRGLLGELIAVGKGAQAPLTQASALGELRARLGGEAIVSAYANTAVIAQMLAPVLPYEAGQWADALGLGSLDALYAGFGADEHSGVDLVHLGIGGSEHGLFKAISSKPADLSFANYCSDNTVLFGSRSLDVAAVLDAAKAVVALLPAPAQREVHREFGRELQRELRHVGLTPEQLEQMLRAFGDQVGFAVSLEAGAIPKPEVLLRIGVREPQTVGRVVGQLEQLASQEAGVEWKTRKVGDLEIRYFSLPIEDTLQLTPCYVLAGDSLLIGSDVMGLTKALRRAEEPDDSLTAQDDFRAMAKEFDGACAILHLRAFRLAELGWRSVETFVFPQLDAHREQVGFGSEALPDAETMASALGSSTFAVFVDAHGCTQRHRGLITIGSLLATIGTLADEVLSRASAKIY